MYTLERGIRNTSFSALPCQYPVSSILHPYIFEALSSCFLNFYIFMALRFSYAAFLFITPRYFNTASMFAHMFSLLAEKPFDLQYSIPMTRKDKPIPTYDFNPDTTLEEELDFFTNTGTMAATGNSSPFIKDEPEDYTFPAHSYVPRQQGYMEIGQQFGQSTTGSVNPSELTMQANNFNPYNLGGQQNLSSSFNLGNSGIGDDELLDLDLNDGSAHQNQMQRGQHGLENGSMHAYFPDQGQSGSTMLNNQNQMYSNTPDGAPIQSPFAHNNFNYAQFGSLQQQHIPQASPHMRPTQGGGMETRYINGRSKPQMPQPMDRQNSDSRSPMTPKTPGLGGLNLGTPESGSLPSQPIHTNFNQHRHQKSLSNQWDSTPGSVRSFGESPISSPGHPASHAQISEILKSGKHASLPAKVETGHHPIPAYQTQEAKRRRRRESHNMVERRRRDNINERIQELSHLVPLHRLEDEKVRKHIVNNSPLSPTLAAAHGSPPQATSLLAGGGRRATGAGSISMGIPVEEKDKGPNKGDILNGAVSWTRDLMWALHIKLQQETELAEIITRLGGEFPFEQTEEEKRMKSELLHAFEANDPSSFQYTRGPGSGLRVPNYTNAMGEPLNVNQNGTLSPQSLSPGVQSGGSGANSGGHGHPQFWNHNGHDGFSLKEEDEYGMDMN